MKNHYETESELFRDLDFKIKEVIDLRNKVLKPHICYDGIIATYGFYYEKYRKNYLLYKDGSAILIITKGEYDKIEWEIAKDINHGIYVANGMLGWVS